MNPIIRLAIATCAFLLGSLAANAAPDLNPANGHYYEVIADDSISWDDADAAAMSMTFLGKFGHLATITSGDEDVFIESLRKDTSLGEVWVGGFQDPLTTPGAGDNWTWVNGEGTFPGNNLGIIYANWDSSEPNDNGGPESYLGIGLFGDDRGWNDERPLSNIDGYVVEFDTAAAEEVPAEDCAFEEGGCVVLGGAVTYTFPPGTDLDDEEVKFAAIEDDGVSALCGVVHDHVYSDPFNTGEMITFKVPEYLCSHQDAAMDGSHKLLVVIVDSSVSIATGIIQIRNDPSLFVDNPLPCDIPIPAGVDIREQDVIVYSTTDPQDMVIRGHADEFNFDCGSSRGRMRSSSVYGIDMQYVFQDGVGNDLDWMGNPESVEQAFIAITGQKLGDLQEAVENAKPALKNGDYKKIQQQIKNAIKKHNRGNYESALGHINKLLKFVRKANFAPRPVFNFEANMLQDFNDSGQLDMRGSNIKFMYEVKVITYAP